MRFNIRYDHYSNPQERDATGTTSATVVVTGLTTDNAAAHLDGLPVGASKSFRITILGKSAGGAVGVLDILESVSTRNRIVHVGDRHERPDEYDIGRAFYNRAATLDVFLQNPPHITLVQCLWCMWARAHQWRGIAGINHTTYSYPTQPCVVWLARSRAKRAFYKPRMRTYIMTPLKFDLACNDWLCISRDSGHTTPHDIDGIVLLVGDTP